ELASKFRYFEKGIGLNLARAEFVQVALHVVFEVIGMLYVIERKFALRRGQVIDPGQLLALDKFVVEPEALDDEVVRRPADRARQLFEIGAQEIADMQSTGVMIGEDQQHAPLALGLFLREAPH